jgi:hypothetical protein
MIIATPVADDTGAMLVKFGLVSASKLETARQRVAQAGGTIGESLVVIGAIEDDALTEFYRTRLLVPQVDANSLAKIPRKALAAVPADVAIELRLIPVAFDRDGNLVVAMSDPANTRAIDELGFFTSNYVVRNVATQAQIAWCLAKYYNHVTELAQRQMIPVEAPIVATHADVALQSKVDATRRRILAPVTSPIEVQRPRSDVLDEPLHAEPVVAPTPVPTRPRSASGEIRLPSADSNAREQAAPMASVEIADEASGPIITIEAETTEPAPVPLRQRKVKIPDPPELAARAGEVAVALRRDPSGMLDAQPAVMIDMSAWDEPPAVARTSVQSQSDRSGEIVLRSQPTEDIAPELSGVVTAIEDPESAPILLYSAMAKSGSGVVIDIVDGDEASVPIELTPKAKAARPVRPTQLGFGPNMEPIAQSLRPHRDTEVTDAAQFDDDGLPVVDDVVQQVAVPMSKAAGATSGAQRSASAPEAPASAPASAPAVSAAASAPAASAAASAPAPASVPTTAATLTSAPSASTTDESPLVPSPPRVAAKVETLRGIPTVIHSAEESTRPFSAKIVPPAAMATHDPLDDGWGPPGTTIPPPYLGAAGIEEPSHHEIPIAAPDSAPLPIAQREAPASVWRGAGSADAARALEASTSATFQLLTELDRATSRDEVINALVTRLATSHRDAGFVVVRGMEVALFAQRPGRMATPPPTASLSEPSSLQHAYGTRIPYRGELPDAVTRTFMQQIFARAPSEILLLPIAVRERTVGIWCATERTGAVFDEQLALVARAAGTALERIVRSKTK